MGIKSSNKYALATAVEHLARGDDDGAEVINHFLKGCARGLSQARTTEGLPKMRLPASMEIEDVVSRVHMSIRRAARGWSADDWQSEVHGVEVCVARFTKYAEVSLRRQAARWTRQTDLETGEFDRGTEPPSVAATPERMAALVAHFRNTVAHEVAVNHQDRRARSLLRDFDELTALYLGQHNAWADPSVSAATRWQRHRRVRRDIRDWVDGALADGRLTEDEATGWRLFVDTVLRRRAPAHSNQTRRSTVPSGRRCGANRGPRRT